MGIWYTAFKVILDTLSPNWPTLCKCAQSTVSAANCRKIECSTHWLTPTGAKHLYVYRVLIINRFVRVIVTLRAYETLRCMPCGDLPQNIDEYVSAWINIYRMGKNVEHKKDALIAKRWQLLERWWCLIQKIHVENLFFAQNKVIWIKEIFLIDLK